MYRFKFMQIELFACFFPFITFYFINELSIQLVRLKIHNNLQKNPEVKIGLLEDASSHRKRQDRS